MDLSTDLELENEHFVYSGSLPLYGLQSPACSQLDYSPESRSPQHARAMCEPGASVTQLEADILYDEDLEAHFNAVSLYLQIDTILLESISYLRQEGFWVSDVLQLHGPLPLSNVKSDQTKALAALHHSFFHSPPSRLFDLICRFRRLAETNSTASVDRLLSLMQLSISERQKKKQHGRRTAPRGRVYECPSAKCRKFFKKSGHARNHVATNHPEYLQIHPNFSPELHLVDLATKKPVLRGPSPFLVDDTAGGISSEVALESATDQDHLEGRYDLRRRGKHRRDQSTSIPMGYATPDAEP